MTEPGWILASVLGTTLVILLSLIAFAIVSTLLEVRATARSVRALVERIGPQAEVTVENLREISDAAARGTQAVARFSEGIAQRRAGSVGSGSMWAMLATAAMALFTAYRRRRAARRGAR